MDDFRIRASDTFDQAASKAEGVRANSRHGANIKWAPSLSIRFRKFVTNCMHRDSVTELSLSLGEATRALNDSPSTARH
jgi:hypothetical protein